MKTNVYIDGFNLYFGCLKGTPYRWLKLDKFAQFILPTHSIHQIKYYTALVHPDFGNSDKLAKQRTYIRALNTLPNVSVIYGTYRIREFSARLAEPPRTLVRVTKPEEKGSDVNLAAQLVRDAFNNDFDIAAIVSNDSDLFEPIRIIKEELGKQVVLINPHATKRSNTAANLRQIADEFKTISPGLLKSCQFPLSITDLRGAFTKPVTW